MIRLIQFASVAMVLSITSSLHAADSSRKDKTAQAIVAINRSKIAADAGNWSEAISEQKNALAIRRELFGESYSGTIACLKNLGWLEMQSGSPEAAITYYQNAIDALESTQSPGTDNERSAILMQVRHHQAWTLHAIGSYRKAASAYYKALAAAANDRYFIVILHDALKLFEDMAFENSLTRSDVKTCQTLIRSSRAALVKLDQRDLYYRTYLGEATLLRHVGWDRDAMNLLTKVVQTRSDDIQNHAGMADILFAAGHLKLSFGDHDYAKDLLRRYSSTRLGTCRSFYELTVAVQLTALDYEEVEQTLINLRRTVNMADIEAAELLKLAKLHHQCGQFSVGIELAEKALSMAENSTQKLSAHLVLFDLVSSMERWQEAQTHLDSATEQWEATSTKSPMRWLEISRRHSQLCFVQGDFEQTHQTLVEAVELCERLQPSVPATHAAALKNLAEVELELTELSLSDYETAHRHLIRSMELLDQAPQADEHSRIDTIRQIAICLERQGKHAESRDRLIEALKRLSQLDISADGESTGENHKSAYEQFSSRTRSVYLSLMQRLAYVYLLMGDYPSAEQRLEDIQHALASARNSDLEFAKASLVAGTLASTMGRFVLAENYLRVGLTKVPTNGHHPSLLVQRLRTTLGRTLLKLRQVEPAKELFVSVADLSTSSRNEEIRTVADAYLGLSTCHRYEKELDEAIDYAKKAVEGYRSSVSVNHPDYASSLEELAVCWLAQGKFDEAITHFQKCVDIRASEDGTGLGNAHPDTARARNHLAAAYLAAGSQVATTDGEAARIQYEQAKELLIRAELDLTKRVDDDNPSLCLTRSNLALAWELLGRSEQARRARDASMRGYHSHIFGNLSGLNEPEQLSFLYGQFLPDLHEGWSYALTIESDDCPQMCQSVATWAMNFKGILNDVAARREQRHGDESEEGQSRQELRRIRNLIASLSVLRQSKDAEGLDALIRKIKDLQTQADRLDKSLGQGVSTKQQWLDYTEVSNRLKPNELAIDFVSVWINDPDSSDWQRRLIALVFSNDRPIEMIDLGPEEAIESIFEELRPRLSDEESVKSSVFHDIETAVKEVRVPLARLSELVLGPLSEHLHDVDTLYLSPDGVAWFVPWSCLLRDDRYLIEDFQISTLISLRELVTRTQTRIGPDATAAIVIANPLYSYQRPTDQSATDDTEAADPSEPESVNGSIVAITSPTQSSRPMDPLNRQREKLPSPWRVLPGTRDEAKRVVPYLRQSAQFKPLGYEQAKASETVIRQARNPEFLLIGTHGYFHGEDADSTEVPVWERTDPEIVFTSTSLIDCGLAMAGADHAGKSQDNDDGLLLGLEVLSADLRATRLVVLSACETGLGNVRNGEGVAGLRHAFHLAGAQQVVSSLWTADDTSTALLMEKFWKSVADGEPFDVALQSAKRHVLKVASEDPAASDWVHPYFWAAFEISGIQSQGESAEHDR